MMTIISALIGLMAGILLTILSEVTKKASVKKSAASKLYSETTLISKEILEANLLVFASLSDKIYNKDSYSDIGDSAIKLEEHIIMIKKELFKNPNKLQNDFSVIKNDKLSIEKQIELIAIYESKYKTNDFIVNRVELATLSAHLQPKIIELIDNYFYCAHSFKYFLIRLKTEEIDLDKNTNDFLDAIKYLIKTYKDRKEILDYSRKVANMNFFQLLFN